MLLWLKAYLKSTIFILWIIYFYLYVFYYFLKKITKNTQRVHYSKEYIQLNFFHIIFLIMFLNKNKW